MKTTTFKRSALLLTITSLSAFTTYSQGNNWKLDGNNNASASTFIGSTTNQPLIFKTNNLERFRINGNGQFNFLGLGAGLGFLTTDANGLLQKTVFTGNANQVLLGNGTFGTLASSNYFSLQGANQLYTSYKLGIGVSAPNEMLEVNGNAIFNGSITAQGINITEVGFAGKTLFFKPNGMCLDGYDATSGTKNEMCAMFQPLFINSKATFSQNTIINTNNIGKVGIGTETPQGKLDVNGSVYLRNDLFLTNTPSLSTIPDDYTFLILDPTTGKASKGSVETVKALVYANPYTPSKCDNPSFVFATPTWANGPNKIYVQCPQVKIGISTDVPRVNLDVVGKTYTGSLTIGEADPTTNEARVHIKVQNLPNSLNRPLLIENGERKLLQLENSGLLLAREVKLDVLAWPDYVFSPTYELKSLTEVKQFIAENKHLPNVPSATEMETNGLNVAETDKMLMQKVEELTLYLIQLNEQLEAQKKEIEALKNTNK